MPIYAGVSDGRRRRGEAFTLIEVLVVVAIIALLISILLPSLQNARAQARKVKCMSNVASIGKATHLFAVSHKGRGQLVTVSVKNMEKSVLVDPSQTIYAYQRGYKDGGILKYEDQLFLKSWPAALGRELGITSIRSDQDVLLDDQEYDDIYPAGDVLDFHLKRFGKYEIYHCPSDPIAVRRLSLPRENYGVFSYSYNDDVFGHYIDNNGEENNKVVYADGKIFQKPQLRGILDKVVRPSEVLMWVDGGNEAAEMGSEMSSRGQRMRVFMYVSTARWYDSIHYNLKTDPIFMNRLGYLEGVAADICVVPTRRHGTDGTICAAYVDGHGEYSKGSGWTSPTYAPWPLYNDDNRQKIALVKRYMPNTRVTPYNP